MAGEYEVTKLYATIVPKLSKNFEQDLSRQIQKAQQRINPTVEFKLKVNQRSVQAISNQLNHIARDRNTQMRVGLQGENLAKRKLDQLAKTSEKRVKVNLVNERFASEKMNQLGRDRTVKLRANLDSSTKEALNTLRQVGRSSSRGSGGSDVIDNLRFQTLQAKAMAKDIRLELKLDEGGVPAKLAAISRKRTVEIDVDVNKSLSNQGKALLDFMEIGTTAAKGLGKLGEAGIGGITNSMDALGKSFNRMNDVAGIAGVVVSGVAKAMKQFAGIAGSAAEGGAAFGAALAEAAASAGITVVIAAIVAVILSLVAALAVGTLAAIGFAIAAVVMGAVVSALAIAASGLAAALAGVTAAIGAVAAGIGVAALALYPVIQAFQEFTNVQGEAGKASGAVANGINQQASALRSADAAIRSAKRGIIDANQGVKNAQQNLIQAQRSVRDASENLSDAYRNQLRARERLNEAEKRAAQNLEDLRRAARDAAGEEEDAELRLIRARERLDQLDPNTDDQTDYREALRDVERAERDLEDTRKDNKDTLKEYEDAKKKGIKGDEAVKTAIEGVADADRALRAAQERQLDAANQLSNAEFEVSRARYAQVEATYRLRDAELDRRAALTRSTTAADTSTAAQRKLSKMYGQLTAEGQAFFETIKGIYFWVLKLSKIAQQSFLPGLNDALKSMTVLAPIAEAAVKDIGGAMGDVSRVFGRMFASKSMQRALKDLTSAAADTIRVLGIAASKMTATLLPALGKLVTAAVPLMDAFGDGMVVIGRSIAILLGELSTTRVIDSLSTLVRGLSDVVGTFLEIFGRFISGTAVAMERMMPTIVNGINTFVDGFFLALEAFTESGLVNSFFVFIKQLGDYLQGMVANGLFVLLGKTMGQALEIIGKGLVELTRNERAVASMIMMLEQLPVTIAAFMSVLPDILTAFNYFVWASSLLLQAVGPDMIRMFALGITSLSGIVYLFAGFFNLMREKIQTASAIIRGVLGLLLRVINVIPGGILERFGFSKADQDNVKKMSDGVRSLGDSAHLTGNDLGGFMGQLDGTNKLFGEGADKALTMSDAIDTLRGKINEQVRAEREDKSVTEAWQRAKDDLSRSIETNGRKITGQTEAAKKNRDAFKEATRASYDRMLQDIKSGTPMQKAIDKHKARTIALQNEFGKSRAAKEETQRLITKYGEVPPNVQTLVKLLGYPDVKSAMDAMLIQQRALMLAIPVDQARREFQKDKDRDRQRKYASGGRVRGPGSGTSDSIPAWLSNNEFVIRAKSAMKLGPDVLEWINDRGELPPQFAKGGAVTWPFAANVSKTKIDKKWLQNAFGGGPLGDGSIMGYKRMFAAIKQVFPYTQLYSGYRNSRTSSGNKSYHAFGRAIDITPTKEIVRWITANYGKNTKELISPWTNTNLHHGKPYPYSREIQIQHGATGKNAHIHWAMKNGGLVSGPGGSETDRILRALSNGEFVMSAKATQAIGVDRLRQWNDTANRSTKTGVRAKMNLASAQDFQSGPTVVDNSRVIDMNVHVTEDHQVDMLTNSVNALM